MKDMLTMGIESTLNNFRVYEYYKIDDAVNDMKTIIQKHCILKSGFENIIDSIMLREIADSHHFEIQQAKNDLSTTDAIVRICREIKEMLK